MFDWRLDTAHHYRQVSWLKQSIDVQGQGGGKEEYLSFDPARTPDLKKLDALIRAAAPKLTPHFHSGTTTGEAGMRMKMLGYGKSSSTTKAGKTTPWLVIGIALQKSFISVYFAVRRNGKSITER